MKYRIVYTILGPGGIVEAPNVPSPVEAPGFEICTGRIVKISSSNEFWIRVDWN